MRFTILTAAACASLAFVSVGAEAMPAGALSGASAPEVTLVSGGCGYYRHRTPAGFCVPNHVYRPYGYYPAYGYYRPYARCGIHIGPLGVGGPC
jgi:hypothetical protein